MFLNARDKEYIQNYSKEKITFEDFQKMAEDDSLSPNEKIGFPDAYRSSYEQLIVEDIFSKSNLAKESANILDLGCGCSNLTHEIINFAKLHKHKLILADSKEMLSKIDESENLYKIVGKFPDNKADFNDWQNEIDFILIYSVIQHIYLDTNIFSFVDGALDLLKPGGRLLLGDIPNQSKRNRFFSSEAGIRSHQAYTKSDSLPEVNLLDLPNNKLDDSIILSILDRYRRYGYETYILPQNSSLPMSNRREDILIIKH